MTEDKDDRQRGNFFSRMFAVPEDEEGTTVYSREDLDTVEQYEEREASRGFTVERAAEIIRNLPPEVPRSSAFRIVRQTLVAAGVEIGELESSTKARESRLDSEMRLSEARIKELREKTEEVIRTLQEEMRKAREARDNGVAEQEKRISDARTALEDVDMVRDFFGLPHPEGRPRPPARATAAEQTTQQGEAYDPTGDRPGDDVGDDTQVLERPVVPFSDRGEDDTQVLRRPGPLSDEWTGSGSERGSERGGRGSERRGDSG